MKKFLTLMFLGAIVGTYSGHTYAAENSTLPKNVQINKQQEIRLSFENRLNLTEKQKEKAKKIHQKGATQIQPVMRKIGQLKNEIAQIKKSNIDDSTKQSMIDNKYEEIRKLDKKAHDIRKSNSKEFEKILTQEQKNELAKMKAEGRKKFEKNHPPRPPFNMFGPEFRGGDKGLFPPPPPPRYDR